jgi:hypothetical protein
MIEKEEAATRWKVAIDLRISVVAAPVGDPKSSQKAE